MQITSGEITILRQLLLALLSLAPSTAMAGCVIVGRSSGGHWFFWPGGLGLLVMTLAILWMVRRR